MQFFIGIKGFDESMYPDEKSIELGLLKWFSERAMWRHLDKIKKVANQARHLEIKEGDNTYYQEMKLKKIISEVRYSEMDEKSGDYNKWHNNFFDESEIPEIKIIQLRVYNDLGFSTKKYKIDASKFSKVISSLSSKDRDVLMTYMHYESKLPRSIAQSLAIHYGIKVNSLRAIKRRALGKVRKKVLDLIK